MQQHDVTKLLMHIPFAVFCSRFLLFVTKTTTYLCKLCLIFLYRLKYKFFICVALCLMYVLFYPCIFKGVHNFICKYLSLGERLLLIYVSVLTHYILANKVNY